MPIRAHYVSCSRALPAQLASQPTPEQAGSSPSACDQWRSPNADSRTLAARLLGIDNDALLDNKPAGPPIPRDGTLLGALFESLVTMSVRTYAQANEARVSHLRTRGGEHEIDLIIERCDDRIIALEVKLAATPNQHDTRHLKWLADTIGNDLLDAAIITTGTEAYRRTDTKAVVK